MSEMTKEFRKISQLHLWEKNPRGIMTKDFDRLKRQIQKLGQYKPLLITEDGTVLGGNMRLRAYKDLGIEEIWVSVVKAETEAERLEYALSDNDRAGYWEEDKLAEMVINTPELALHDYKIDLGEPKDLKEILSRFAPDSEEDESPEVDDNTPAVSKLGTIYQLGNHRLMCGSSTDESHVAALMNSEQSDMVFTDPPYNVNYQGAAGAKREGIMNDKMSTADFEQFLFDAITNAMKHNKGAHYWCMSPKEMGTLKVAFERAGGHWQSFIIWVKNTFNLSGADYQPMYEPILYGWKQDEPHFFAGFRNKANVWEDVKEVQTKYDEQTDTTEISFGGYKVRLEGRVKGEITKKKVKVDIWRYDKPSKSEEHPTMKPIALCMEAIRNNSLYGGIIMDLFGGSGSTLIASEKMGRKCYMMELDPKYADVIRKRWAKLIGNEQDWQELTPAVGTVGTL